MERRERPTWSRICARAVAMQAPGGCVGAGRSHRPLWLVLRDVVLVLNSSIQKVAATAVKCTSMNVRDPEYVKC